MTPVTLTKRLVITPYLLDNHSNELLKTLKKGRSRRVNPVGSQCKHPASCALRRIAQSAGLRVSETKHEMIVDPAIVIANCLKNNPGIPEINATGTNTAHNVRAIAMSAVETSVIVSCAASRGDKPLAMLRSTFSTTTMASSTTMPTASTSPNRDRLLIDPPSIVRIENVPISETGIATTGMIVARQL